MSQLKSVFKTAPFTIQNIAISLYNAHLYRLRHGKLYREYRTYYAHVDSLTEPKLIKEIELKKQQFF